MKQYAFKTDKHSMEVVLHSLMNNKNLNAWEKGFVDNINNRFTGGAALTENQLQKLSDIWDNY